MTSWRKRVAAVVVFVVAPLVATGAGCAENKAATEACKASENGEKCEACCKANGAADYAFVSGKGCVCRG